MELTVEKPAVNFGVDMLCIEFPDKISPSRPFDLMREQVSLFGDPKVALVIDEPGVREKEAERTPPDFSTSAFSDVAPLT